MGQTTIVERLREPLAGVGVDGYVHARAIDGDAAVGLNADEVVVAASVFKVAVAVELLRQAAAGAVDLAERCRVPAVGRTPGPTGLSAMRDDAELSLRDLAQAMLAVSDNAATDVIIDRLGLDRINVTLRRLGLRDTVIVGDCAALLASAAEDVGVRSWADVVADWSDAVQARLVTSRALTPATATRTTPREMTRLLGLVWRDEAGPAMVREELGELMSQQVCGARLASGFPRQVRVSAKSGGLFGEVRNEVGVVEYPDGGRYAVAVFTRGSTGPRPRGVIDAAIGIVAREAVEHLRG